MARIIYKLIPEAGLQHNRNYIKKSDVVVAGRPAVATKLYQLMALKRVSHTHRSVQRP